MRILYICTESYGGFGGVAVQSMDVLDALTALGFVDAIDIIPRIVRNEPGVLSSKVRLHRSAAQSFPTFLLTCLKSLRHSYDLVICNHINLIPIARALSFLKGASLMCILHGVEAWSAPKRFGTKRALRACDRLLSVSSHTKDRFLKWSNIDPMRVVTLPNTFKPDTYGIAPKDINLLERYKCAGDKLILTVGRLDALESQKGIDELLELLPELRTQVPNLKYMIIGDGDDQPRLEKKAYDLGLKDAVIFCGRVSESEKKRHYDLADVFSMVGRQEGFGIVFLEAMACGIPVIASLADGSQDAVLNGKLGWLAHPSQPETIKTAVLEALQQEKKIPEGLTYFSFPNFMKRLSDILQPFRTDI